MSQIPRHSVLLLSTIVLLSGKFSAAQTPVEPLLQRYCLGCHNDRDRESGLSLQTFDSLRNGGDSGAVLSEDPADSILFEVLDPKSDRTMPPVDEAQPTEAERQRLREWAMSGARFSAISVGKPDVPDMKPFAGRAPAVLSSSVSPDQQSIVFGGDRFLRMAKVDGSEVWKQPLPGKVSEVSFSGDGRFVIAGTGTPGVSGEAMLVGAENGEVIRSFGGHTDAVYSARMSPDGGLLATAGYDRQILVHRVDTGEVVQTMSGHNGSIFSLAFDPAGELLCSASADSTVKVWNVASGQRLDTLSQPQGEQYSVVISKDGQRVYAAGADSRIRAWKLVSRKSQKINPQLVSRFAHEQNIGKLVMSEDGTHLASAADDGTIRVWTSWPLEHVCTLPRQTQPVTSMVFVGNDRVLVSHLDGGTASLKVQPRTNSSSKAQTQTVAMDASESGEVTELSETAGNDTPQGAQVLPLPATVSGVLSLPSEAENAAASGEAPVDYFRFSASAGQQLLLEVVAARDKSPLDSKIEVLTVDGERILQTQLQAVRDSYFTFRGKDSDTSGDFRLFNWQEMELNEYLYSDGEVVRLWLYPRGPDSGFNVYPGFGKRHTFFGTTPTAHALQAPCFIVQPRSPDEKLVANGLPVFPIYFENDDDPRRAAGRDSRLFFTAPRDSDYLVRLTDARGFSGDDFKYKLTVRTPRPSYSVSMNTRKLSLQHGTGREIMFTAKRIDGFEAPITIDAQGLPSGFRFSGPVKIQSGQLRAFGTIYADSDAVEVSAEQAKAVRFVASADAAGESEIGTLEELKLLQDPKLRIRIGRSLDEAKVSQEQPATFRIRPGETIRGMLIVDRLNHKGVISFGKEDAGRNLPHGVFVDNIGLNGLLLLDGQTEREFFITASPVAQPGHYPFYIRANIDGITSFPATLEIVADDDKSDAVTSR